MSHYESQAYDYDQPRKVGHLRLFTSLMILAVLLVIGFLFYAGLVRVFRVSSGSMEPTLQIGDRVLVDGSAFYDRFDIVAFKHPKSGEPYVKRIVGLPGDEIKLRSGVLHINGEEQYSRFIKGNNINWEDVTVEVPAGHVFVLGDNRNDTEDSLNFGPVDEELIIGVPRWILLPRDRMGKIKRLDELDAELKAAEGAP